MISEEHINSIKYFIQEKGDITRYCAWNKIKEDVEKEYPELIKALKDVQVAKKILTLIVENLDK